MSEPLFDETAQLRRRNRAMRQGFRTFLYERAIDDLLERLHFVNRRFQRAAVIGCPTDELSAKLRGIAADVRFFGAVTDAAAAGFGEYDLVTCIGMLDTANDVRLTLRLLHALLRPDALLAGMFAGNDSLPVLRSAMLAADQAGGRGAAPRVHPRIDAASVAPLLQDAGFNMPVVDIDRVRLRYRQFGDLVADLRGMAATNALTGRSRRPLFRSALAAAITTFEAAGDGQGTVETIEVVHYAAWSGPETPEQA